VAPDHGAEPVIGRFAPTRWPPSGLRCGDQITRGLDVHHAPAMKRPPRQWALPDRVFFAAGACHILAFAFLERYPRAGFKPIWIKPGEGYIGNHIIATDGEVAFDYHGYTGLAALATHTRAKAARWWPGWNAEDRTAARRAGVGSEVAHTYDSYGARAAAHCTTRCRAYRSWRASARCAKV
jgi:hypothetical protein